MKKWSSMKFERLENIVEIIGGNAAPKGNNAFGSSGLPFIKMKDLGNKHLTNNLVEIENLVSDSVAKANRLKVIKKGAILLPRSGSVGLNHRAVLGVDAYMVSHICALQLKNEKDVFNQYLYYYLTTINFNSITKKTTGLDAITFQDLAKVVVPIPTLSDQIYFANILSQAENLITKRRESIRLLDEFLKSTFLEMFGDPLKNEKKWKFEYVSEVSDIISGYAFKSEEYSEDINDVKICGGLIIYSGWVDWAKANYWPKSKVNGLDRYWLMKGDIIMAMDRPWISTGFKLAMIKETDPASLLIQRTARIRCRSVNNHFLYFMFSHKCFEVHCKPTETTVPHISPTEIKNFKIPVPPIALQTKFSQIVEKTEALKSQYQQSLQELENLYGSLSQWAFKGELRAIEDDLMLAAEPKIKY